MSGKGAHPGASLGWLVLGSCVCLEESLTLSNILSPTGLDIHLLNAKCVHHIGGWHVY